MYTGISSLDSKQETPYPSKEDPYSALTDLYPLNKTMVSHFGEAPPKYKSKKRNGRSNSNYINFTSI